VPDAALHDLRDRLRRVRRVDVAADPAVGGVDPAWIDHLLDVWAHRYDWRAHEERIRALPWELVDGSTPVRIVHHRVGPGAPTVVLLHGWPDSVLRFDRVAPLLAGCNLVILALPGFPFAAPVPLRGLPASAMGAAVERLGYDRYTVSAGDVGTDVAEALLAGSREHVASLHELPRGGHFAAWEQPEAYAAAVREAVALAR